MDDGRIDLSITFYSKKNGRTLVIEGYPEFGQWTEMHLNLVNAICNCMDWTYMPTHDKGIPFDLLKEVFHEGR